MASTSSTLYLLDISSFIFRAYYAIRPLSNRHGQPTNAVYGVATMLARLIEEARPEHLVCVYDSKEPSFRKEIYAEYKANRGAPPDDLVPQFDRIEQLISAMGIPSVRKSGVEADDLIATMAREWQQKGPDHSVVIVTGDKDLMQLVNGGVKVWDTLAGKQYGAAEVEEKFGVPPSQIRDYLALVGDTSDNVPGVAGVGPKTASELLKAYGTIDAVIEAAQAGKIKGKRGETLAQASDRVALSRKLVSLDDRVDFTLSHEGTHYQFQMKPELEALFEELDFQSLIPKWREKARLAPGAQAEVGRPEARPSEVPFEAIFSEEALKRLLLELEARGEFGFDLETTSLKPWQARLVGIALCPGPERSYYVPVGHRGSKEKQIAPERALELLRPVLENPRIKKIGQNLKYDWSVLMAHGLRPDGIGADTMVASYALDPEGRHNLDALAERYLRYRVVTYEEVCGKGKAQIGFDEVPVEVATRYAAEDAWVAVKLWETLRPQLQEQGLMQVFAEVDLPCVPVLARMEMAGIAIDVDWLKRLSCEFSSLLAEIEGRVAAFAQGPVNLNSPKQLAQLLFEQLGLPPQGRTKTGYSTDASVLEALAPLHEVPRQLLEYREVSKLKSTYVDPLPELRDPSDGRIHSSFHQAVTATGRLSSADPNLQNIPIRTERGRRIRRAFVAPSGHFLLSADYSQIELRILAHMSGDPDLVASFQRDEDVHRRTASELFGVSLEAVDDRMRGIAKAINFGLMYGKTAFGLAQELHIPRKEAAEIIERYFRRYAQVKRFLDQQIEDARSRGWTVTLLGRKRYLRDIHSKNPALRANAERMAMNAPIQGTAADLMKLAMIAIDGELIERGLRSRLLVQVHDEVLLECPEAELQNVQELVTRKMEGAMQLSVPLRVNHAYGRNWMDL